MLQTRHYDSVTFETVGFPRNFVKYMNKETEKAMNWER
jgi:hypothetical protein